MHVLSLKVLQYLQPLDPLPHPRALQRDFPLAAAADGKGAAGAALGDDFHFSAGDAHDQAALLVLASHEPRHLILQLCMLTPFCDQIPSV